MAFTGNQILNQVNANWESMHKIEAEFHGGVSEPRRKQLDAQLEHLWRAQNYWAREYKIATGVALVLVPYTVVVGDPNAWKREQEEAKQAQQAALLEKRAIETIKGDIAAVRNDLTRLTSALQGQYDISMQWQHVLFSHWVRMGAGLDARHPLIIKRSVEERVTKAVQEAEAELAKGNLAKAQQKLRFAAKTLKWGYERFDAFMNALEVGAKRAETGIKISAAVAGLIVAAPIELGVLGTMGIAALGEGAQQGTLLIAKGVDPGQVVSAKEVRDAAVETAIAAGTAGAGKGLGKLVGKYVAPGLLQRILKKAPTKEQIEWAEGLIERYVATNAAAITKKMLQLDTDPDWNWWAMIVAPAINPAAVELVKENEVPRVINQGITQPL